MYFMSTLVQSIAFDSAEKKLYRSVRSVLLWDMLRQTGHSVSEQSFLQTCLSIKQINK